MSSKRQLDQLRRLRRRLGSFLDESLVNEALGGANPETPGAWVPPADVLETADDFLITAELPGVLRKDLALRLDGTRLELRGRRRPPAEAGSFHRLEGRYGTFQRLIDLTAEVDEAGIEATLDDGVLAIRIPKKRRGMGRREIPVDWEVDDA